MISTEDAERHATNLELFLDLVFVFAVTQIASLVSHDLTWSGAAEGLLIAWLVWWQWSQFTWAGSAMDLQDRAATRVLVLCTIPATLTMAVAIPEAFHDLGIWFGVAYMAVQLLVLGDAGHRGVAGHGNPAGVHQLRVVRIRSRRFWSSSVALRTATRGWRCGSWPRSSTSSVRFAGHPASG